MYTRLLMSKSASIRLKTRLDAAMGRAGLAPAAGPVVVGVSGGVDSMVLLHLLLQAGYEAVAVHVNYGLRGEDSDADERLVEDAARKWGAGFRRFDAAAATDQGNFQSVARDVRYARYAEVASLVGAQAVATGHHRQDRIETLLMRLLRGTSPASWDGLKEWNPPYIRPLLGTDRSEIVEYAEEENIPWRDDQSNFTDAYARNLLRNTVLPKIGGLFPGWEENVERLSEYGAVYGESLDALSGDISAGLRLEVFEGRSQMFQAALLHRYLSREGVDVASSQLPVLLQLAKAQKGRKAPLGGGLWLVREAGTLSLHKEAEGEWGEYMSSGPFGTEWPGLEVPFGSLRWEHGEGEVGTAPVSRLVAPQEEIVVRPWRAGDKIPSLPGRGSRKVSDLLTDWKVPTRWRAKAWVVTLDGKASACIFAHPGEPVRVTVSEPARRTQGGGIRIDFNET